MKRLSKKQILMLHTQLIQQTGKSRKTGLWSDQKSLYD